MTFLQSLFTLNILLRITSALRGGYNAAIGDVPYQVSVQYRKQHVCNGVLVFASPNQQVVLTTANCIAYPNQKQGSKPKTFPSRALSILAGRVRLDKPHGAEQTVGVRRIRYHEKLWQPSYENDIAVLFLQYPFNITRMVKPINLPGVNVFWKSKPAYVIISGWGKTSDGQKGQNKNLRIARVDQVDHQKCFEKYFYYQYGSNAVFESSMCVGGTFGHCKGDEGGAAMAIYGDEAYLIGVFQWKHGSCEEGWPGIYASMIHFVKWTSKVAGESNSTIDGYGR